MDPVRHFLRRHLGARKSLGGIGQCPLNTPLAEAVARRKDRFVKRFVLKQQCSLRDMYTICI